MKSKDVPTGHWLIDFGTGYNIVEIIIEFKSTLLGRIFLLLGLLFLLAYEITNRRSKKWNDLNY